MWEEALLWAACGRGRRGRREERGCMALHVATAQLSLWCVARCLSPSWHVLAVVEHNDGMPGSVPPTSVACCALACGLPPRMAALGSRLLNCSPVHRRGHCEPPASPSSASSASTVSTASRKPLWQQRNERSPAPVPLCPRGPLSLAGPSSPPRRSHPPRRCASAPRPAHRVGRVPLSHLPAGTAASLVLAVGHVEPSRAAELPFRRSWCRRCRRGDSSSGRSSSRQEQQRQEQLSDQEQHEAPLRSPAALAPPHGSSKRDRDS